METCSPLAIDVKISDGYYTVRWKVKNFSDNSLPCEYTCKTCGKKGEMKKQFFSMALWQ